MYKAPFEALSAATHGLDGLYCDVTIAIIPLQS